MVLFLQIYEKTNRKWQLGQLSYAESKELLDRMVRKKDIEEGHVGVDPNSGCIYFRIAPVFRRQLPNLSPLDCRDEGFPQRIETLYPYERKWPFKLGSREFALGITHAPIQLPSNTFGLFKHWIYRRNPDRFRKEEGVTAVTAQRILPGALSYIVLEYANLLNHEVVLDESTFALMALCHLGESSYSAQPYDGQFSSAQSVLDEWDIPVPYFKDIRQRGIFS